MPSALSLHYSGEADGPCGPFALDMQHFEVESERAQLPAPHLAAARTQLLDYFRAAASKVVGGSLARRVLRQSWAREVLGDVSAWPIAEDHLHRKLSVPSQGRLYYVRYAMKMGWTDERIHQLTSIDPWFLDQISQLVEFEDRLVEHDSFDTVSPDLLFEAKRLGYSDPQLANIWLGGISTRSILEARRRRKEVGIEPVFKLVDTCAAEFEAVTPYFYSTYERSFRMVDGDEEAVRWSITRPPPSVSALQLLNWQSKIWMVGFRSGSSIER